MKDLGRIAEIVDDAARHARPIAQFEGEDALTEQEAYAVQAMSIGRRLQRGERRIGMKMGFTSRSKMRQMGVHEMIWGRLTDDMRVEEGGTIDLADYVHPRVEPEVAFLIDTPLAGEVSNVEALAAVKGVAVAMEIIDSRYEGFKFSLGDVVADNSSSSGFVIGRWFGPETDVRNLGLVLEVNGRPAQIGSTASILGDPIRSLVAAARLVARWGERLEPDSIVLAGGATAAVALAPGQHVRCDMQTLGSVAFSVGADDHDG